MLNFRITAAAEEKTIPAAQYGHFAEHLGRCIYDGIWAEESSANKTEEGFRADVLAALQKLHIPVLRWPGGCFADAYHWRDGIGVPETRPVRVNTTWGWPLETNRFGTHEFFRLCELLGCDAYLAANMGSGTVQEMADWVEYVTSDYDTTLTRERRSNGRENAWRLPYLGIGNEVWGGGGFMSPDHYADLYRNWQYFAKPYDHKPMMKIACGANADDYNWTERLMARVDAWMMQGMSIHYYTVPSGNWNAKGHAVHFTDEEYRETIRKALKMNELITKHSEIMDKYDPENQVALIVDEWGSWYDVTEGTHDAYLYQQNTMRDAVLAACTLHIFHRHTDRVKMANLAQTVNVLQALILTEGDRMLCTPTYHVFDLFQPHKDAVLLSVTGDIPEKDGLPQISVIATQKDGETFLSLCNPALEPVSLTLDCASLSVSDASAQILTGDCRAHNTFDHPDAVAPSAFADYTLENGLLTVHLPACAVAAITLR